MNGRVHQSGFTLVELLIVTGLMGALLGLILVGLRANEDVQIRQAANTLASAIRQAQTVAMNNPQGAALVIGVANTGAPTTSIWQGDILPTILGSGIFSLSAPATSGSLAVVSILNADSYSGYQIRFSTFGVSGPWGPWLAFSGTSTFPTASLQRELGQTTTTAVLPSSGLLSFEIAQRPTKSQAITLPKLAVIDTRWSSIGNDVDRNASFISAAASTGILAISSTTSPYRNSLLSLSRGVAGAADIVLAFDRTGCLVSVVALPTVGMPTQSYAPFKPTAPIYFLVTGALAGASASSALDIVQSPNAIWVAIDPATGAVQTGKNQPPASIDLLGLSNSAAASRIDAYFRSLRTNVFPSPFVEAGR